MSIRVLPTDLVNKIAAGEVIERPASIVKELVENSLDAGAARIEIAVEDGGRKLISVCDDGCGMDEGDLALAFAPHATSKLGGEDDLFAISTMGFRGEALASIASVSHASIRSLRRDSAKPGGLEIDADGGVVTAPRPCAAAPGTTVTVRDLFFNTPARRKFLKATPTELGHISEMLCRLALPHPQVAFRLTHNGKVVRDLPAVAGTAARIADLFGPEIAAPLLKVAPRGGAVEVAGLVAPPQTGRGSGKWQYFFLNGRYIRDRLLAHALREAYRGLADPSQYPAAFLFLRVDPADVDVNVHPTKIEVRFRDGQAVYGELLASLRETLNAANLSTAARFAESPEPADGSAGERGDSIRQALADFFKSIPSPQPRLGFGEHTPAHAGEYRPHREPQDQTAGTWAVAPLKQASYVSPPMQHAAPAQSAAIPIAMPAGASPATANAAEAGGATEYLPYLPAMQVHDSYIVVAIEDGLEIIDQHALHERLLYNDLRRRLGEGRLAGQRLLLPQTVNVAPREMELLERHAELLGRLGVETAPFGPASIAIQQFPSLLLDRGTAPADFIRQALDLLAEDENADSERLLEKLIEMLACKAAVKAGQPLDAQEIQALLRRRQECDKSSACPHGRPTTLKLTLKDLQKQFKRT